MKPFQTFRDGSNFFSARNSAWTSPDVGAGPQWRTNLALWWDPLRPRGGTVGFSASEPQLSLLLPLGWAGPMAALLLLWILCRRCSKNLLMVAGSKSLDWWMEITAGANWAHYPSLPFFTGGSPSHYNSSYCCSDYLLKTPFCSILCLVYVP